MKIKLDHEQNADSVSAIQNFKLFILWYVTGLQAVARKGIKTNAVKNFMLRGACLYSHI
jgi:hypothetical protein